MEKWSEERVEVYKFDVEGEEKKVERYESDFEEATIIMRSSVECIERAKVRKQDLLSALWLQGWKRENGQWVRLEEN